MRGHGRRFLAHGSQTQSFYIFSILALLFACCVVCLTNCVYSVLSLILCFLCTACIWLLLNAEFFAIILVLVYVGAVLVLFLFVVMLIDVQKNILRSFFTKFFSLIFLLFLMYFVFSYFFDLNYFSCLKIDESLHSMFYIYDPRIEVLGVFISISRLFEFVLIGILLLVGIVAAIALSCKDSNDSNNPLTTRVVNV